MINEGRILQLLTGDSMKLLIIVGIPVVYWLGTEAGFNILVMQLLGPNLGTLFEACKLKFSLKTALMIADQMVE